MPGRDRTFEHGAGAPPHQAHQRRRAQKDHHAHKEGPGTEPPDLGPIACFAALIVMRGLSGFLGKGFDGAVGAQHLGRHGRKVSQCILGYARHAAQPARIDHHRGKDQGKRHHHGQCQYRTGQDHHEQRAGNGHQRTQGQRQVGPHGTADHADIAIETAGQFAHPMGVEIAGFECEQLRKDRLPQVGHHAFANQRDEIIACAAGHRHDCGNPDNQPAIAPHHVQVLGNEAFIDRATQHGWNGQRGDGRNQKEEHGQAEAHRVTQQKRQQPAQRLELAGRSLHLGDDLFGVCL